MTDKEFNQKFEKFLNDNKFSKADIVGMYVLCNEREHDLKQELSNYRAALSSRENELRYKETVIKELDEENKALKTENERKTMALEEMANYMSKGCVSSPEDCSSWYKGFCTNQCACYFMQAAKAALQPVQEKSCEK